jgi:hypothetical protein
MAAGIEEQPADSGIAWSTDVQTQAVEDGPTATIFEQLVRLYPEDIRFAYGQETAAPPLRPRRALESSQSRRSA